MFKKFLKEDRNEWKKPLRRVKNWLSIFSGKSQILGRLHRPCQARDYIIRHHGSPQYIEESLSSEEPSDFTCLSLLPSNCWLPGPPGKVCSPTSSFLGNSNTVAERTLAEKSGKQVRSLTWATNLLCEFGRFSYFLLPFTRQWKR